MKESHVHPGIQYLAQEQGEDKLFRKDAIPFQFAPGVGYQPRVKDAGGLVIVKDLASAINALQVIMDEGEGADGSAFAGAEKAHFFVVQELVQDPLDWEVFPVMTNPTTEYYARKSTKQIYEVRSTSVTLNNVV